MIFGKLWAILFRPKEPLVEPLKISLLNALENILNSPHSDWENIHGQIHLLTNKTFSDLQIKKRYMNPNRSVRVHGLEGERKSYNGATGQILQYFPRSELFSVHLVLETEFSSFERTVSLKPQNLEIQKSQNLEIQSQNLEIQKPQNLEIQNEPLSYDPIDRRSSTDKQNNRAATSEIFKLSEKEAVSKLLDLLSSSLGIARVLEERQEVTNGTSNVECSIPEDIMPVQLENL